MPVGAVVYFRRERNLGFQGTVEFREPSLYISQLSLKGFDDSDKRKGNKHVKVIWLHLKSRPGRKHFLAVNHLLVLHALKHFIQMTLTVLGVMPGVKRLFAWYIFQ